MHTLKKSYFFTRRKNKNHFSTKTKVMITMTRDFFVFLPTFFPSFFSVQKREFEEKIIS
ncbi:hypothetical protein BREVNS_1119 [Brevinematales bacterium NS]|nr:hypothetical protein BREVNS_1119 [Brevinematales bacterium NS]